jgi:hypothetical protein
MLSKWYYWKNAIINKNFKVSDVYKRLSRVLNYRGRNCLLGPGKHLVWQIEVTVAKSSKMTFAYCSICYFFYVRNFGCCRSSGLSLPWSWIQKKEARLRKGGVHSQDSCCPF